MRFLAHTGRREIEPAEVKVYRALEAVRVPVTSSSVLDELDLAVEAFSGCIGNGNAQVGQDVREMVLEHLGELDEGFEARMRCPEVPPFEMLKRPRRRCEIPKLLRV
jgi:hypothetical protein